ncbi:MAG: TatD family hydrolase [Desulfatirhabdiaceae bacterium]
MKLFDSHCHLDDPVYDDIDSVIQKAAQSDVHAMMIAGINLTTSFKAVSLSTSHPEIFASVGFHPHDASSCNETALRELIDLAKNPRVRAWGEIGLDFNRLYSPRDDQEKWLIRQIEIADAHLLPIIFHERETEGRLIEILKIHHRQPGNGVIHCFSGNRQELLIYLDMGYCIGITGIVTLEGRGKALRSLARLIPIDRLLIETDAPYLTPSPEKNHHRRNEPAFVRSVLFKLAEIRDEDPEFLSNAIWDNTCRLYRISGEGLKTEV